MVMGPLRQTSMLIVTYRRSRACKYKEAADAARMRLAHDLACNKGILRPVSELCMLGTPAANLHTGAQA